ncbi:hypothetical protein GC177_00505 [bacterium]|nr:hypothetical protein [bacterium]
MSDQKTDKSNGVIEEFSPLRLRQIKWGLLEYFLENERIGKRGYSYWINRTLNENKHLLSKDEQRLLKVSAELNEHDPWNWVSKNHVPPDTDKIRVYEKYVSLVMPHYKTEATVEDLYISTCTTLTRFTNIASCLTDRALLNKAKALEQVGYYHQRRPFGYNRSSGNLVFFRAIDKTPFLRVHKFDFFINIQHYAETRGKIVTPTTLSELEILFYLQELPADKIGDFLVLENVETGLIVPSSQGDDYHGILQTKGYETNSVKLYFQEKTDSEQGVEEKSKKKRIRERPEDNADLIVAQAGFQKRKAHTDFFKIRGLSNFKKFVANMEGPVL